MKNMTIYLIRHGQKENVPGDPPLTPKGRQQAEKISKYLKNINIHATYSSPYLRAKQTADIIAKQLQISVITDERLKERLNWGDRKDETFQEFWAEWQKTDLDRTYTPVNGNSSLDTGTRMKQYIESLYAIHAGSSIIIVTHGGTIGDFLRAVIPDNKLPHVVNEKTGARYLEINECSITIVQKEAGTYILEKINSTDHLK